MFGKRSSDRESKQNAVRRGKLVSKILMRIIAELENRRVPATPALVDAARAQLEKKLFDPTITVSEKELQSIVSSVLQAQKRSQTSMAAVPPPATQADHVPPLPQRDIESPSVPPSVEGSTQRAKALLMNTSRKQRQMLADEEWSTVAEKDRVDGIKMKKEEKKQHWQTVSAQRAILDGQVEEHRRQQEAERQAKLKSQREMDEHIENHRALTQKEREDAFHKAMNEKAFRAQQQQQLEQEREKQRTEEHNDQVRHCMMVRQELQNARQQELDRKMKEKAEWKRVLEDNADRLNMKAQQKEEEREYDRKFQREYAERLDRDDRERAEARAHKDAKQAYFQKLASGVAKMFEAKQQDLGDKIEGEYQEQLRRALEDESFRRTRNRNRIADCQETRLRQIAEKKRKDDEERESQRQLAEQMREQNREAQRQEEAKRSAARAEAQRLKEFLNTQLQMQHFKETRPLETSITRPPSRSRCMYSPSRYTPSIKPDM